MSNWKSPVPTDPKQTETERRLLEIQEVIQRPNELVREIEVPPDLLPALSTGRFELLKLAKPRDMNAKEVEVLLKIIGTYAETNAALVRHAEWIGELAEQVRGHFMGLNRSFDTLRSFAKFQIPVQEDGE